jgi:hypothetical protein
MCCLWDSNTGFESKELRNHGPQPRPRPIPNHHTKGKVMTKMVRLTVSVYVSVPEESDDEEADVGSKVFVHLVRMVMPFKTNSAKSKVQRQVTNEKRINLCLGLLHCFDRRSSRNSMTLT